MIASVVLVAVAFVTLVAGWLGRVDPLIFASIVASVLAGAMLVASVVRPGRRKAATMAGHAPALAPVGDGPKPPVAPTARTGDETATWSGTVRTAPSSAPRGVLSGGPGASGESGVPEDADAPYVDEVEDVDETRGFLDDDLRALSERDVFADVEDAELVDEAAPDPGEPAGEPVGERAGEERGDRPVRPPSFPRPARPARPARDAASRLDGPAPAPAPAESLVPAEPQEPSRPPAAPAMPGLQGEEEAEPAGPRILYGRPLVTPPGEEPAAAAMRGRRKPAPGKLVGPATASRPRVAGPADRSRAPKPAAAKPAAEKPTAAKAAPAKPGAVAKMAPKPKPPAKPVAKSPVKPPAAKPAVKPPAQRAPQPGPQPGRAGPQAGQAGPQTGPQKTAAAAMPKRRPAPPPSSDVAGPGAPRPAAKPAAPRSRPAPPPARPEAGAATAPDPAEEPQPGGARPGPRSRISFLGNRPPSPKSTSSTDEPS